MTFRGRLEISESHAGKWIDIYDYDYSAERPAASLPLVEAEEIAERILEKVEEVEEVGGS